ncbi:MAG: sugar ABC transporter substrate-binding protein, partial [Acetatifactor sp.]|nr:sugar ABC transporter substrate-binding protein [Acetatifactor sp.]
MSKRKEYNYGKKLVSCMIAASLVLSVTACGNKDYGHHERGVANPDTSQTEFAIMGGQSALSPGYDNNEVLKQLQADAGINIDWTTMSESLGEQVNIRIAGEELPDAFMGVGFSNYDISRYGDDGTFIDLTPYLTEEYMPNLTKILEENPDIR